MQTFLAGTHHCIVAQIAYDDAPVPAGVSPLSWDQLAQRNLQLTLVDNPGPAAAHRAPQTFDTRPSRVIGKPGVGQPSDELMIDWGRVPAGSAASIYWPGVSATEVVALAKTWTASEALSMSDANTVRLTIEHGVSYIPIPASAGERFAGLLTLDLPAGIKAGQSFDVLVRRISTRVGKPPPPQPPVLRSAPQLPRIDHKPPAQIVVDRAPTWRFVVGSFIVRIPVSTAEHMLFPEALTLSIMKWRLAHLSPGNRWVPVLERYIKYLSGRFDAIGGDASQVPPSLTCVPPVPGQHEHGGHQTPTRARCGKVAEVLFDCHGAFDGFVLDDCCEYHRITTRERAVAELILRALRDNLTVCVHLCPKTDRLERLALTA